MDSVETFNLVDLPTDRVARISSDPDAAVYHVARAGKGFLVHRAPGSGSSQYRYDGRYVTLLGVDCYPIAEGDPVVDGRIEVGHRHRYSVIFGMRFDDHYAVVGRAVTRIELIDAADAPGGLDGLEQAQKTHAGL